MTLTECPECGGRVSRRATQCPHCGAPLMKKSIAMRSIALACLFFVSAVVGLFQFYNVRAVPVIEGKICLADTSPEGGVIRFLAQIASSVGGLVYFNDVYVDWTCFSEGRHLLDMVDGDSYEGYSSFSFYRRSDASSSGLPLRVIARSEYEGTARIEFNFHGFLEDSEGETNVRQLAKSLLSAHGIPSRSKLIDEFAFLFEINYSGFNLALELPDVVEAQSTLLTGFDGYADRIDGPFHVRSMGHEQIEYALSVPSMDSVALREVRCATKGWGAIRRFFLCPFL